MAIHHEYLSTKSLSKQQQQHSHKDEGLKASAGSLPMITGRTRMKKETKGNCVLHSQRARVPKLVTFRCSLYKDHDYGSGSA
jgi:hypothetical protein